MLVSDFHATFNACLHMHELFTAPRVQSEDVRSLNTRKIPRALARGGAGRPCAFLSAVMEADGGGVLPDSCTVAPRCITVLSPNWDYSSQTASAFCFLWQSGERFSFSRGGIPQKKRKRKRNMASSVTELLPQPQLSDRQSHRSQPREKIIEFQFCCVKASYL